MTGSAVPAPGLSAPEGVGWGELRRTSAGAGLAVLVESRPVEQLSDADLVDALGATRRLASHYEARQLALAAQLLARRQAQEGEGADDLDAAAAMTRGSEHRAEVRHRVGMELRAAWSQTRHRVETRLHLAHRLGTDLPLTWGLLAAGRVDEYAAQVVCEELTKISDPALVAVAEEVLWDRAHVHHDTDDADAAAGQALVGVDTTRLRRLAKLVAVQADPDAYDRRFCRAYAARRVARGRSEDGMGVLHLEHTVDQVAAAEQYLTRLARGLGRGDPRTMDQRRADLAIGLLTGTGTDSTGADSTGGTGGTASAGPGPRVQLIITVPIQTLMGVGDQPGVLQGGEPIPASLVRRLAADPDSVWYRLLTDPAGQMAELSTQSYRHGAPLVRAVDVRDQTCRGPCCNHPAVLADHDHSHAWPHGPTEAANCGPWCRSDHRVKHSPGFGLGQPAPGVFTLRLPSGHRFTRHPDAHPVDTWPSQWIEPVSTGQLQDGLRALEHQQQSSARAQIDHFWRRCAEQRLRRWRAHSGPEDDPDPPPNDSNHNDLDPTSYQTLMTATAELLDQRA